MFFICYLKCSTCQKARQFILNYYFSFTQRHIIEEALSIDELLHLHQKSCLSLKTSSNE